MAGAASSSLAWFDLRAGRISGFAKVSPWAPAGPSACSRCGEMMDVYGDHAMCCPRASFVARHQWLADGLARVAALSGAHVQREVAVAGLLRPADLLISGWGPRAVAVDVTIRRGLAKFDTRETGSKERHSPNTSGMMSFAAKRSWIFRSSRSPLSGQRTTRPSSFWGPSKRGWRKGLGRERVESWHSRRWSGWL